MLAVAYHSTSVPSSLLHVVGTSLKRGYDYDASRPHHNRPAGAPPPQPRSDFVLPARHHIATGTLNQKAWCLGTNAKGPRHTWKREAKELPSYGNRMPQRPKKCPKVCSTKLRDDYCHYSHSTKNLALSRDQKYHPYVPRSA